MIQYHVRGQSAGAALAVALLLPAALLGAKARANDFRDNPRYRAFVQRMVDEAGFERQQLQRWFRHLSHRPKIIEHMKQAPERKLTWADYRPLFLEPARIRQGLIFWRQHRGALERAQARFDVPPAILVAILGVETRYGRHEGRHRVLDALATLGFDYPPRADFFRGELEAFLRLAREKELDPATVKGSYAGAMGYPQFIASSYRAYAVDFDGDGTPNLLDSPVDAIGSIANYLAEHGWRAGEPIRARGQLSEGELPDHLVDHGLEPAPTLAELRAQGVRVEAEWPDTTKVTAMALQGPNGRSLWLGRRNFYVITRYNHSRLYAMAVSELAEALRAERASTVTRQTQSGADAEGSQG